MSFFSEKDSYTFKHLNIIDISFIFIKTLKPIYIRQTEKHDTIQQITTHNIDTVSFLN